MEKKDAVLYANQQNMDAFAKNVNARYAIIIQKMKLEGDIVILERNGKIEKRIKNV